MKDASIQIKSFYNEGLNRMNAARPFFTNKTQMGVMSHTPSSPGLGRQGQADLGQFKASLLCTASSRPARAAE